MGDERKEKVSLFNDAIFAETIRKEMRRHQLYENYMLTPSKVSSLVITKKPTGDPSRGSELEDKEYLDYVARRDKKPKQVFPMPMTTSQSYGWDSEPLMRNTDKRFHFPRVVSEITKTYGQAFKKAT